MNGKEGEEEKGMKERMSSDWSMGIEDSIRKVI